MSLEKYQFKWCWHVTHFQQLSQQGVCMSWHNDEDTFTLFRVCYENAADNVARDPPIGEYMQIQ